MNYKIVTILKQGFRYYDSEGGALAGKRTDGYVHYIQYLPEKQVFAECYETHKYNMDIMEEQKGTVTEISETDLLEQLEKDTDLANKVLQVLNKKIIAEIHRLLQKGFRYQQSGGSTDYGQTVGVLTTIKYNKDTQSYDYEDFVETIINGEKVSEDTNARSYSPAAFEQWMLNDMYNTPIQIWGVIQTTMQTDLSYALHDFSTRYQQVSFQLTSQETFALLFEKPKTSLTFQNNTQEIDIYYYFNKKGDLVEELLTLIAQHQYKTI